MRRSGRCWWAHSGRRSSWTPIHPAPDAFVILLGGSAPLTAALFGCRVDAIAGTRVVGVPTALRVVGESATFPGFRASGYRP